MKEIGTESYGGGCALSLGRFCQTIDIKCLSGVPSLVHLQLENVDLNSLIDLPNLRRLEFVGCDFKNLQMDAFQSMPNLESLEISNRYTLILPDHFTLKNLPKLRRFVVKCVKSFEFLQKLPPNLLILILLIDEMTENEFIKFEHSNIEVLDLNFSFCSMEEFDAGVLAKLPKLKHFRLVVDSKRINFDYEFLSKNLESLSMDVGNIEQVDFTPLVNLRYFQIFKNWYKSTKERSEPPRFELSQKILDFSRDILETKFDKSDLILEFDLTKENGENEKVYETFLPVFPRLETLVFSSTK